MVSRCLSAVVVGWVCLLSIPLSGVAAEDWRALWNNTVKTANEEGRLAVYASVGFEPTLQEFQKKYPRIKLSMVLSFGLDLGQRILSERRAGKNIADVYLDGVDTAYVLLRSGALDPLAPTLILPEVVDRSHWWQGKHHYADPHGSHILVFQGSVQIAVAYNTKLVNPEEITSYRDFLRPQWKGKIVAQDPEGRGGIGQRLRFFYHHPELGPEFVRALFGETDMVLSRDRRQVVDWLARGRFPIAFQTQGVQDAKEQGLPVDLFSSRAFKEGAQVDPTIGAVSMLNGAPHPNAAKLLTNWILSREGQIAFQRQSDNPDSMREDIPKDDVAPQYRRVKGVQYMMTTRPEWIDMRPIYRLIREARSK